MALFYDRDFGHNPNRGYDRGYRSQAGRGRFGSDFNNRGYGNRDRFGRNEFEGGAAGWGRSSRMDRDRYDTGYKSRWQTDYGDPFNDRGTNTPIRMTQGEFRGSGNRNTGWGSNYDRNYSANPMGYDPYFEQTDRSNRSDTSFFGGRPNRYDRGYRGRGMQGGYDQGWF